MKVNKDKRGRLSKVENKQIAEFVKEGISDEEIARRMKRAVGQISTHTSRFYGRGEDLPAGAVRSAEFLRQLRNSAHWKFLKEQYSPDELSYYEGLYASLMAQFEDDILATEQLQILQAIDTVIMINRHKRSRKLVEDRILELEEKIRITKPSSAYDDQDRENILAWECQKQALISQANARTKDFTDLSKKFEETIGKLKGTREQRIKNIESSKYSWTALIKTMQDKKVRDREGRHMELVKFATDKAEEEMRQPHKYVNGVFDQPLLQPEHVLIDRAEE